MNARILVALLGFAGVLGAGSARAQSLDDIEVAASTGGSYQSSLYSFAVKTDGGWVPSHTYALTGQWKAQPQLHKQCKDSVTAHWTKIMTRLPQVEVRLTQLSGQMSTASFSPSRYGIDPDRITGSGSNWISFLARVDEKVWINLGNDQELVFLFIQPPKPDVPPGTEYYGPGVHDIGMHEPTTSSVYLENGAWVKGVLWFDTAHSDIEVLGPGVLSGEDLPWIQRNPTNKTPDCMLNDNPNYFMPLCMICPKDTGDWKDHILTGDVNIDGPTLVKSPMFNYYLFAEGDIRIENTEIIAPWNYNTDGFWVRSFGQTSRIENSFVLNNDDAIHVNNVRSWTEEVNADPRFDTVPYDIHFENIVVASRAPFLLGYGYHELPAGSSASALHTDVIMAEFVGTGGGGAVFHAIVDGCSSDYADGHIWINDVVIEDGKVPRLLQASVRSTYTTHSGAVKATYPASGSQYMGWGCGMDLGQLDNVTLHGVDLIEGQRNDSVLYSKDASNRVKNITLNNVRVEGRLLTAGNERKNFETHDLADRQYNVTRCLMFIPQCHNPEKWFGDNAWVDYAANNAANHDVACASEAVAMATWCGLGPSEPMYAKFEWNYETVAPDDHTVINGPAGDADGDIIVDTEDNCLGVKNPDQADFDSDGTGDACDTNEGLSFKKASVKGRNRPNRGGAKIDGHIGDDTLPRAVQGAGLRLRIASIATPTVDEVTFTATDCSFKEMNDGSVRVACKSPDRRAKVSLRADKRATPQYRVKASIKKTNTGEGLQAGPIQVDLAAGSAFASGLALNCNVKGRRANSLQCRP